MAAPVAAPTANPTAAPLAAPTATAAAATSFVAQLGQLPVGSDIFTGLLKQYANIL